ncbi:MAG: Helix-turn-helix domain [Bacteroidota bacterium]|jgi:transcriptional regulator with XRE-family HTH domain
MNKENSLIEIGNFIKNLRIKNKLSIEKLAYKSDISYALLHRIEKGTINTSIFTFFKLLSNLNCNTDDMCTLLVNVFSKSKEIN